MKPKRLFVALLLLLMASGAFAKDALTPIHDAYGKILRRYTKSGEVDNFQDLYIQMIWHATFISEEFSDAFRAEYDRVYPRGQDQKVPARAAPWLNPGPQATFFIALYAKKREMKELGNDKSLQDLSLEVDGKIYKSSLVEKIRPGPFEQYFFSYSNLWFQGYRVVFPYEGLHNLDKPFQLHLDGVAGNSTLKFR